MKIVIEIDDALESVKEQVLVKRLDGDIVLEEFYLTVEGLAESLMDGQYVEAVHSPILPKRCVQYSQLDRIKGIWQAIFEVPKDRFSIIYKNKLYKNVGFPRMLFVYQVTNEITTISTIYACRDNEEITEDTQLYHFPFSHVSIDGHVCMGRNILPSASIKELENFHFYFLTSPFGDDYGSKTLTGKSVKDLFEILENKDFPDDWLVPKNLTLGQAIEQLK
jgi:hypothetical protein